MSAYNAIIKKPMLNTWREATSTYHLLLKIPYKMWDRRGPQRSYGSPRMLRSHAGDQEKMLFVTSQGLFCYKVMPFRLKNAGVMFQRHVNKMFIQQIRWNVEVYVEDMLVKSKEEEHQLDDLKETFETPRLYGMKLNPSKCLFKVSLGSSSASWYPSGVLKPT